MSTKYVINGDVLSDIADAIRAKTGGTARITPPNMPGEIADISTAPAIRIKPYVENLDSGYVYYDAKWHYSGPGGTTLSDVYKVKAGESYLLSLDETVGDRFRVLFSTADTSQATENVSGTQLSSTTTPGPYKAVQFVASDDGYVTVTKVTYVTDIQTYMYQTSDIVDALKEYIS